jgi:protection of telomeres protein 1
MKLSTISEIDYNSNLHVRSAKYNDYKLPFVNAKHRARVRIVDFYPPEIEMFAHSTADPAWKSPPEKRPGKVRWEWGFVLLLEDAVVPPNTVSQKLRVFVGNENAQFLFGRDFPNAAE